MSLRFSALAPMVIAMVLMLQPGASTAGCIVESGAIDVPQVKLATARIGPLTSLANDPGDAPVTYYALIEDVVGTHAFSLTAEDGLYDLCDLPVVDEEGSEAADFDVTFYKSGSGATDTPLARHQGCGDESGTVPFEADFAVIWLSLGSEPGAAFTYAEC